MLERSLKPTGIALIGESYWRATPSGREAVEGSHAQSLDDYLTLWELIQAFQSAGWDLVEMVHADEHMASERKDTGSTPSKPGGGALNCHRLGAAARSPWRRHRSGILMA